MTLFPYTTLFRSIVQKLILNNFGVTYKEVDLKRAMTSLHIRYEVFSKLIERPGFSWDAAANKVMANVDDWVEAHEVSVVGFKCFGHNLFLTF